ncbi:sigma-54-dependent Fis family transcriptional regulator [Zoogloea sp. LCSB751]|uniref:sigma-54-dependent Fis family transcriptional regulator n=1 Tax=Zoogloea sp. LCSB751 TaxID=1965277 RepID=UPI0009A4B289|nr:sigma-54-dependent Fis family transcriptional regulator [Zoogloea sp. LCSB751]
MQRNTEGQVFSNPYNDSAVMAAWESFLNGDAARNDTLRTLVDRSWRRCQEARVDPVRRYAPDPLPEHTLYALRESNSELLEASAPVMAYARDFLAETGTMMLLADTQCTILTMEGDTPTVDTAESIRLIPGVTWSERLCGTNAIGTALAVGQPVQIHSAEHFCAGIKRWTCSAAVIRHPQSGEIVGVIDVSGLSETYSRQSLALAVTTASRIESRLAAREMELRCRLLEGAMGRWGSSAADGLILFDRRGVPVKVNEHAASAIATRGGDLDVTTSRIPEMALAEDGPIGPLPEWMNNDWLVPVSCNGLRLGTLLIMPLSRGNRSIHTLRPAADVPRAEQPAKVRNFASLVSRNPALLSAIDKARQLARSKVPVLLLGETGVGKEEFARGIHDASQGASGTYVALNCGGLSRELLASELFGYAEGAFTGARKGGMMGKIESADGGTLFLDEIGEMPIDLQPHLLRVLEEGEIHRLGENTPRKVNFRLVAATHRNLREEVAAGRFRMDLYYRIAVTTLNLPPLRERREDIPLLVDLFLARFATQHGLPERRLGTGILERLQAYAWPGNVRELRNAVESMVLMSDGPEIGADVLPGELSEIEVPPPAVTGSALVCSIADGELELIRRAIAATGGNLTWAARQLNIAKSTLYLKLKRYGLEVDRERARTSA